MSLSTKVSGLQELLASLGGFLAWGAVAYAVYVSPTRGPSPWDLGPPPILISAGSAPAAENSERQPLQMLGLLDESPLVSKGHVQSPQPPFDAGDTDRGGQLSSPAVLAGASNVKLGIKVRPRS